MRLEDWGVFKLDDLGTVQRGRSRHRPRNDPALYGGAYPFFQTGNVKAANLYLRDFDQTYNEAGLAQSRLWKPGTLCITIAANIAETAVLAVEGCFPDSVVGFTPDPAKSDVRFIKYYIDLIKMQMQSVSHGATQDNLSLDKLLRFDFRVPSVQHQLRIASILSAYDDLIENNLRRTEILEEMAQALYREWFVEFRFPGHEVSEVDVEDGRVPSGWVGGKAGDFIDRLPKRQVYKSGDLEASGLVPVIDQGRSEVLGFHDNDADFAASPEDPVAIFGDHTCKMQLMVEPFSIGPNVVPFMSATDLPVRLAFFMVAGLVETQEYKRHWNELMAKVVLVPPEGLAREFSDFAKPLLSQANLLRRVNRVLARCRDLLLPRLISGELDVSELDIDVGDAA